MVNEFLAANQLHQRPPDLGLDDHIDVVVGTTGFAFEGHPRMATPGSVAGTRHGWAKGLIGILRVLLQGTVGKSLLVAQLDPTQVQHRVLHGDLNPLTDSGFLTLKEGCQNRGHQMHARAGISNLGSRTGRRAIIPARGAHGSSHGLGDGLVCLAVCERTGAEPLAGGIDYARIDLPDDLPTESLAVQSAGRKVFDQHVTLLDQLPKNLLSFWGLGVDGDAALIAVEHGEIQAIDIGQVPELLAGDIASPRQFDFDNVRAKPGEHLGTRRPHLDVGHVKNTDTVQSFSHGFLLARRTLNIPPHPNPLPPGRGSHDCLAVTCTVSDSRRKEGRGPAPLPRSGPSNIMPPAKTPGRII